MSEYAWVTTAPSGRAHTCRADDGVTGWKLHLIVPGSFVRHSPSQKAAVDRSPALCGLRARHGWGLDLFIDAPCSRCLRKAEKLGIPLPDIDRPWPTAYSPEGWTG